MKTTKKRILATWMAVVVAAGATYVSPADLSAKATAPKFDQAQYDVWQSEGIVCKVKAAKGTIVSTKWSISGINASIATKTKKQAVVVGKYIGTANLSAKVTYKVKKKKKTKKLSARIVIQPSVAQPITRESQELGLTVDNARDIGGYKTKDGWTIKRGLLLRTAQLNNATADDIAKLKALNLGTVYDLRTESELSEPGTADILPEGATTVSIPVEMRKYYKDPEKKTFPDDVYVKLLKDEEVLESFSTFFKGLVKNYGKKASLWHCSYGKNRTGLLAAILLAVLNVDRATIRRDFCLTDDFVESSTMLNPDDIDRALDYMDQTSGSADAFVRDKMGLSTDDIFTLRVYYRERETTSLAHATAWLEAAHPLNDADQAILVNGIGGTNADFGLYERQNGEWKEIFTTYAYIGRTGFFPAENKMEGDGATPEGIYHFTHAFGIKDDPGCTAFPYLKVTDDDYWCGISGTPFYNQPVKLSEHPELGLDGDNSEHIIDYDLAYDYAMNISWNEDGTADRGSAIFLHCFRYRHWTGGCVAIPEEYMVQVLKRVKKDCQIVMGSDLV